MIRRAAAVLLSLLAALPGPLLAESKTFRGITEPLNDATIRAKVAGRMAVVRKQEGEFVRRGEVVLELQKEQEELEVARRKLIAESKAELESAQHQAETLGRDLAATKQVFDATQSVSQEELWKKEMEFKMASAERDRLATAEQKEELEYRMAAAELKERVIVAPFDGLVVKVFPHVGDSVNEHDPLLRVSDIRKCRFITYVEAVSAPRMTAGMKVSLSLDGPRTTIQRAGVIEFASPVVDPSSGLREVKVLFDNPQGDLQPGVAGTMSLGDPQAQALLPAQPKP